MDGTPSGPIVISFKDIRPIESPLGSVGNPIVVPVAFAEMRDGWAIFIPAQHDGEIR